MISYALFWLHTVVFVSTICFTLAGEPFDVVSGIVTLIWFVLLVVKFLPVGSSIAQYVSFCRYRQHYPKMLLPKMPYKQIRHLMSIKELRAEFKYLACSYNDDKFIYSDYYYWLDKDDARNFVLCYIYTKNSKVALNPTTYLDYFAMCCLVKRGIKSICSEETVDAQLENLNAIRDVLRDIQDKEIAKMQDVATENVEIEKRIIEDRKVKIKAK